MGNRSTFGSTALANGGNTTSFSTSTVVNRLNQITSQTLTTLVNGTPSSTRTDAFNYDANGNLNTQSNNQNSANTTYTYDEADRLTSVVLKDNAGVNSKKSEYRYDGFSRKVVSKEYSWDANTAAWVKDDEVRRIYDGIEMDVVQERDDTNVVKVNYTRNGNIGGLLSKTDTASGGTFFYHYDGSGNVTQMSDVNQNSVAEYSYDAYGNTLRAVGTQASSNRYRYSTKEYQTATGLYDYGYRFYSPSLGRWINRDPIAESGGLNLYGMVGNDPVNFLDAYGLYPGEGIVDGGRRWFWTGDPNASDEVYNAATDAAADWMYRCSPTRGAYVSWGPRGVPGSPRGTVSWTVDSGWAASVSGGGGKGPINSNWGSGSHGVSGGVTGSITRNMETGKYSVGVGGSVRYTGGSGWGVNVTKNIGDLFGDPKNTTRIGVRGPNGVEGGLIFNPDQPPCGCD